MQELEVTPPAQRLSPQDCFQQANRRAAYPALAIMGAGYAILMGVTFALGLQSQDPNALANAHPGVLWKALVYVGLFAIGLAPIIPAWLWLSRATQAWRVWALRNVDNWPALEKLCQQKSGQKWPRKLANRGTSPERLLELRLIAYRDSHPD